MALEFSHDSDLMFLLELTHEQLQPLVAVLTKGKQGGERFRHQLFLEPRFVEAESKDAYNECADLIAAQFETKAKHTLRKTRPYHDVLCDVCDKTKVNYEPRSTTEVIECQLLQKTIPLEDPEFIRELGKALEALSSEELEKLARELGFKLDKYTKPAVLAAIQAGIRKGGFNPYMYAVIVLHWIGELLGVVFPIGAYLLLTRLIKIMSGPLGWAATGLWAIWKLLGPAYTIVVPATVVIASLRQIHKHEKKLPRTAAG